ncbi:hypothetical protein HMPREF1988_00737 [Porphyromonas gingivalis F0185]|nr:hypothetical protein HMPREF1988_00737 [Porphyromonas gingivalis F0185]
MIAGDAVIGKNELVERLRQIGSDVIGKDTNIGFVCVERLHDAEGKIRTKAADFGLAMLHGRLVAAHGVVREEREDDEASALWQLLQHIGHSRLAVAHGYMDFSARMCQCPGYGFRMRYEGERPGAFVPNGPIFLCRTFLSERSDDTSHEQLSQEKRQGDDPPVGQKRIEVARHVLHLRAVRRADIQQQYHLSRTLIVIGSSTICHNFRTKIGKIPFVSLIFPDPIL